MNLLKWVERKIAFKRLNRLIEKSLYSRKSTSQSQRVAINLWFDDIMVVDIFFQMNKVQLMIKLLTSIKNNKKTGHNH